MIVNHTMSGQRQASYPGFIHEHTQQKFYFLLTSGLDYRLTLDLWLNSWNTSNKSATYPRPPDLDKLTRLQQLKAETFKGQFKGQSSSPVQ